MANTSEFQQHATVLLGKLKAKKEAAEKEYQSRLAEIDREIEAVSITLRLLREPTISNPKIATTSTHIPTSELMGKTARAALIIYARHNGGIVRISEAKPILMGAGVVKGKHAWGVIYTTLARSPEFQKVAEEKGTFRYLENLAQGALSVA
jgi:hypothetical protein